MYPVAGTPPVDGEGSSLTGNLIGYSTSPATTLTITTQPHNATITAGFPTNFVVAATTDSAVEPTYQWKRNGVNIPGATSPTLGLTPTAADNNAVYTVVVSVPGTALTQTSAPATLTVQTPVFASGFLKREFYQGATRAQVENGTAGAATSVGALSSFETPTNIGSNFAERVSGFFIPPADDDYVFFIASDDDSDLFLSTDNTPANKHLIAREPQWNGVRVWNGVDDKRSDLFTGTQWPDGAGGVQNTIHLLQGQRYYIEAVHAEGGGGDNLAVTVVTAAEAAAGMPANNDAPTLTGSKIGFEVPSSTITITQPPSSVTVQENRTATFTVAATTDSLFGNSSLAYQWQRNGVNIAGANSSTYATPLLALSNNNDKYTVVVSGPGATSVTSAQATLTVIVDDQPPILLAAGAVKRGAGIEIGLGFDESLGAASAGTIGNYSLSKGAVTAVRFEPYATPTDPVAPVVIKGAVVLETSGLASGDNVTVTVKNVADLKGNPIPAAGVTKSFTVGKMTWVGIGGNDYQEGLLPTGWDQDPAKYYDDAVALKSDSDFDLISGGTQNWNNYDEVTFAYEEITGDFDRIMRVEYQDPSSQWARAGIMARTSLDASVSRDAATTTSPMGAAMIIRVNPVVQWNGTAGNNSHEWVYRDAVGGNYANSGGGGAPTYPTAWIRLQKVGTLFTGFRSSDGQTWVNIGTHDWSVAKDVDGNPLDVSHLYVGPYFGPELNNNDSWHIGHSVVAKFRDYGPFATVGVINITAVTLASNNITINWTGGGTLEWTTALTPNATWTSTNDSDGSYSEAASTAATKYFRVRQ